MEHYTNLIGGEWSPATSATLPNVNPSDTSDVLGHSQSSEVSDVADAVSAATAAAPGWAATSPQVRADILERIAATILARSDDLGHQLSREEGKTLAEGRGEAVRAGQIFRYFSGEALRMTGVRVASTRPGVIVDVIREPVGVVGIITPWNFPLAIPAWKIAPALAFGNTVVVKPAELVVASAWSIAAIAQEAGLPPGVLNLVLGSGSRLGPALIADPRVSAISFTGSQAVGRQVALAGAERFAKVQLEMGGKNPLIVAADADLDNAVECAVNGSFFSTGQRCTASSRIIVEESVHDAFLDALLARTRSLTVDNALLPGTDIGPVVDARQLETDLDYLEAAARDGAEVLGGERIEVDTPGHYLTPAVLTGTDNADRINREEVFGPVATVLPAADLDAAIALANDTELALVAGICTTSLRTAERFKAESHAGMVMVNLPTAGVDVHVPFGGRKQASYGPREQGPAASEFYTTTKTAYTRP